MEWEINMALGARFQKLRGEGSYCQRAAVFSEGQGGAKFSEGARFSRASYHVFLGTCYFCGNIY